MDETGAYYTEWSKPERKTPIQYAAAAAKSLQSCLTLCVLIDGSPPGSPVPGILQARTLEWDAISFSSAWKGKEGEVAQSCLDFATPWTAAYQAPPPMGFSRQEYWSGVPLPSPGMTLVRDKRPKCWPMVGSKAFWLNIDYQGLNTETWRTQISSSEQLSLTVLGTHSIVTWKMRQVVH